MSAQTDTRTSLQTGNHNPDLAHLIDCPDDQPTAKEWLHHATAHGLEVEALCGHKWVPTRNPSGLEVCVTCLDIAQIRVAL